MSCISKSLNLSSMLVSGITVNHRSNCNLVIFTFFQVIDNNLKTKINVREQRISKVKRLLNLTICRIVYEIKKLNSYTWIMLIFTLLFVFYHYYMFYNVISYIRCIKAFLYLNTTIGNSTGQLTSFSSTVIGKSFSWPFESITLTTYRASSYGDSHSILNFESVISPI